MTKILVLNPFTIDPDAHSKAHSISEFDESQTIQADVAQSDINNIVKSFGLTEQLPYGVEVPEYIDHTNAPNDFHAAMNYVRDAQNAFMEFPADVRARFSNDPGSFVDFVHNPDNRDEAIKLGLVPPITEADIIPTPEGGTPGGVGDKA